MLSIHTGKLSIIKLSHTFYRLNAFCSTGITIKYFHTEFDGFKDPTQYRFRK